MFKVAVIGPESTGKSTLARYLAKRYHGIYISERARTYVEQKGSTDVSWDELCGLAREQIAEMRSLNEAVFERSSLSKVWFDYAFGAVPEWLEQALKAYPMDVYLLTYPDLPWVPDPARSNGSDEIRMELFRRYEAEIQALDIPYYIIRHT